MSDPISIDLTIELFAECASVQLISSEKETGNPFDNTLRMTPELHAALLLDIDDKLAFYRKYLSFKFRVLLAMELNRSLDEALVLEFDGATSIGTDVNLKRLKGFLGSFFETERNAYLARLSQLAKPIVIERYYFVDPSFEKWAKFVEEQYLWYGNAFIEGLRDDAERRLDTLSRQSQVTFIDEINLEYFERTRISKIADAHRALFSEMRAKLASSAGFIFTARQTAVENHILYLDKDSQATVRKIISDIACDALAREELPTVFEFVQVVVDSIVVRYACKFADFLIYDEPRDFLWFTVSSLKPKEQDVLDAGARLHYRGGQGISGSVRYVEAYSDARWVGTNDLANDPRASLYHLRDAAAHKHHLYETVHDYWLFPIFGIDQTPPRLFGALRVINKSRRPDHKGPSWTLLEKLELAEIARALELLLPLFPKDDSADGDGTENEGLTSKTAAARVRNFWHAGWIERTFCRRLISHLMQVALRKIEDYTLGCNVCVVKSDYLGNASGRLQAYLPTVGLEGTSLESHADLYPFVDPTAVTFVFTESGEFIGCRELGLPHSDAVEAMSGLVANFPPSTIMFFVLNRGTKTIRVYGKTDDEQLLGDIYLREDKGYWDARGFQELLDALGPTYESATTVAQRTIKLVLKKAWQLSLERKGAILVISDSPPLDNTGQIVLPKEINVDGCPNTTFSDLARRDGAVWINWSAMISRAGVIAGSLASSRGERVETKLGGARHGAARAISKSALGSLVFAVSQNGGISAFYDGEDLFSRR